ncbi:hypothetical protein [Cupriavidus pauculus]|uniref:hypothetical protein n=1 Tax=Cupriavidus pauculus TaxID=82633 RepID=UPI001FD312B4|nr:hypothetical protein [Cupriavidus pauculus]
MRKLQKEFVPLGLHPLIPYAERYGVADDAERKRILHASSAEELAMPKKLVQAYDDQLDLWLAGDEATCDFFSDEYVAFSAMRMAVDTI